MIISGKYDHDVLIELGAKLVRYNSDSNKTEVFPDVDMSLYDTRLDEKKSIDQELTSKIAEREKTKADVRADAFTNAFLDMTPAQVLTHVGKISNLAEAKELLAKFGLILLVVAKDQLD